MDNAPPGGLRRDLRQQYISMIALSANVGFGFTVNSGAILHLVGPGGATVSYMIASFICLVLISPFVEMASGCDLIGPLWALPSGLLDAALGPILGYMFLFTWLTTYPDELAMTAKLMKFKYSVDQSHPPEIEWKTANVDSGVWILFALVTSGLVNLLEVEYYGAIEYVFGAIKVIGLTVLILVQIAINHKMGYGTRFWDGCESPDNCTLSTGFITKTLQIGDASTSHSCARSGDPHCYLNSNGGVASFLALWTAITYCFFGFLGSALVPIAAGEAIDRHGGLKLANRKSLFRVSFLYCVGMFAVSFNVPYDHQKLRPFKSTKVANSATSPFMIAIVEAGYIKLAHFANAFFVFATWSCASSTLFISSRLLYSLARNSQLPFDALNKDFGSTTERGVPRNALVFCIFCGALAFMSTGSHSQHVLDALIAIGTNCWFIVFAFLSYTFYKYYNHLETRNLEFRGQRPEFNRDSSLPDNISLHSLPGPAGPALSPPGGPAPPPPPGGPAPPPPDADEIIVMQHNPPQPLPTPAPTPNLGPTQVPHPVGDRVYPYRTILQPYRAIVGTSICVLFCLFCGWWAWVNPRRTVEDIVSNYLAHALFILLYGGTKLYGWGGFRPDDNIIINRDELFLSVPRGDPEGGGAPMLTTAWKWARVPFEWFLW